MIIPPYLKPGDTIAITCPAGLVQIEKVNEAKAFLEKRGYKVILGETVGSSYHYFSATDEVRLRDLQRFLDDTSVQAILMGRGGYGVSRIIDDLDFSTFIAQPKWICGFSDITVLHSHINTLFNIATIHSPMCSSFNESNASAPFLQSFFDAIEGRNVLYPSLSNDFNREGTAFGTVVGGNLCMLAHLSGSPSAIDATDKILFLEDIGEYLYNIDRMLLNLKRAGTFDHIKGLICGGFSDIQDTTVPFGKSINELIMDQFKDYDFPIIFDFPTGHIEENYTIILGKLYRMSVVGTRMELITLN